MALTSSVTVANHVMTEIMSAAALAPLRARHVAMQLVNASNIDGQPSNNRVIPKRTAIAEAVDDTEGVDFTSFETFAFGTSITLTPTAKVQGISPTVKSLRKRMPGATYEQVKDAIRSGNPAVIPMLIEIYGEILASHSDALERAALATYPSASESAGTTNTALSFATLIDAKTKVLDNNPDHYGLLAVISQIGLSQLQLELLSATSGLAAVWGSGLAAGFLASIGGADAAPAVASGNSIADMQIYVAAKSLMSTANAAVDTVGAVHLLGRGVTATPGSLRGHAEICEGHAPSMSLVLDESADVAEAIGRHEWDAEEHTDEHICKLIFKAT